MPDNENNPKPTETTGQAAYDYLKNMLDNIADPIFVKDKDHRWVDGNKAFWELMGGPPEKFIGKTDYDFFPKAEADVFWEKDTMVFESRKTVINEEFLTDYNGVQHVISTKKTLFLNEKGDEVLVGIIRDITAEKELETLKNQLAQTTISQKEQQYQSVFESTNDAILIFNMQGHLVEANPAASKIYGYDHDEFIGMHGKQFGPPHDSHKFDLFMQQALAGKRYFVESLHLRKDRTPIALEVNGTGFHYAGEPHLLAVVRDITERKIASERLSQLSEQREQQKRIYETVLSNTADFNYVFDLNGRFTYINKALLDLWGKTFNEAIGKNFFELDYPPELAELLQQQIQHVIATKELLRDETPYTSTAHGQRAYEYIFTPVIGENGDVEAVAGSTRDITEYKEANRRKDQFLAMLAHELRNPLAPISNAMHIMKSSSVSEKIREEAAMLVDRQITQMTHLLNDLLDVSRVTLGKIELRLKKVALSEIMHMAIESIQPLIEERGQTLSLDIPGGTIWLNADITRLSQVFSNLLNNAAKYTEKGGHIDIAAFEDKLGVTVCISDNGIGIPKEVQLHIFDLFAQVDSSMERAQGGLGIGLTLVKNLVEMHKGTVTVDSEGKGKGATFTVRLPIQITIPDSTAHSRMPSSRQSSTETYRVLIVDDNEASAKTLGWTLEMLGHEIKLAHTGPQAIESAKSYLPHIILLDIGLPGMNGYEVCQAIRKETLLKDVILIAQTGWGQKEHLQRSKDAGFNHHLVKPIKIETLQQILSTIKDFKIVETTQQNLPL